MTIIGWTIQNPDLIEFDFNPAGKSKEMIQKHTAYFYSFCRSRENYWMQQRNGILDTATYHSYRDTFLRLLLQSDFYLGLWKQSQPVLVPGFLDEISAELKKKGRLP